jgi:gas vesicle protein
MEVGKKSILKLKILFKKYLTKLGFGGIFDYGDYKKKRNLFFVGVAILSVIIFIVAFMVGEQYKTEALRKEANELQITNQDNLLKIGSLESELSNKTQETIQKEKSLLQCNDELNYSNTKIAECYNETTQLKSQLQDETQKCEQNIAELESSITTCNSQKQAFLDILKNSVRATCCSFGAIQQGLELSWDISGSQIICGDGNYTVNCGTGTTNYPS